MKIIPISALEDNYIWLYQENDGQAFIVDPGESKPVLAYLENNVVNLKAILLTHNHADHVDGVEEIKIRFPNIEIYGPEEVAQYATKIIKPGDQFELLGETVRVILTAGHTVGHVSYVYGDHLFCGDALFASGCGRVFTRDYQAAFDGLQTLSKLPDTTKVYAGHEYTLTNLKFTQKQEPSNLNLEYEIAKVCSILEEGNASLPTSIGKEKEFNLFLKATTVDEFTQLRNLRDHF